MNWAEEFDRRERILDARERAAVDRLYSHLRPKLLKLSRKERDGVFVRMLRDEEMIAWTLFMFMGMSLAEAERTRPFREDGWKRWLAGKKGGATTAKRPERDDSRKLTIATYRRVKRQNPELTKTKLVMRVARERPPRIDGDRLSERQIWEHLKGIS